MGDPQTIPDFAYQEAPPKYSTAIIGPVAFFTQGPDNDLPKTVLSDLRLAEKISFVI